MSEADAGELVAQISKIIDEAIDSASVTINALPKRSWGIEVDMKTPAGFTIKPSDLVVVLQPGTWSSLVIKMPRIVQELAERLEAATKESSFYKEKTQSFPSELAQAVEATRVARQELAESKAVATKLAEERLAEWQRAEGLEVYAAKAEAELDAWRVWNEMSTTAASAHGDDPYWRGYRTACANALAHVQKQMELPPAQ